MDGYEDLISGLAITNAICELEEYRNLRNYLKQKIKGVENEKDNDKSANEE